MALAVCAVMACTDSTGSDTGTLAFSGTLDGMPWVADTAVSTAFGSLTDTTLLISGVRRTSSDRIEEVTLVLHGLGPQGQYQLADTASYAFATFSISPATVPLPDSTTVYWSGGQHPGSLSITSINRTDSLVEGNFTFEAAEDPGSAMHHGVTGHFSVPFTVIPVYTNATPENSRDQPRRPVGAPSPGSPSGTPR